MPKTDSTTEQAQANNVWAAANVIPSPMLEMLLPHILPGYRGRTTSSIYHHELKVSEVLGVYTSDFGNSLLISIADLHNQPRMYRNFLTGGGLRQSSSGNPFGIAFRQASLQGSANYGLVLGAASGVVEMAQVSQPILFSIGQSSPQASPQVSPQFSPQASPQFSPQASPQFSPQGSLQFSPQGSPQFSPQVSPQFSPQASPQFSPQASPQFSPQVSPQFSPQASPQFSPQASPQFSPQASPQFSPQASPQFSPQASPQFSPQGSLQFSPQGSPQFSPQVSPQFSPQASPQFSPQASPQFSPQASPQFSPQASPQFSPQASPQFSPQASPQFSPQASPQFSPQGSPQFSPQASPQFSPQASPQFSPQASPQFSPGALSQALIVFSQAITGRKTAFDAGQAPLTESQASDLLLRSGVDLTQLSQMSQASPFSLVQASGFDGSYIRPFGADTGHDVAGWDMWDSRSKIGTMILGVNDRLGILIEGTNLLNPNALLELSSALDFNEIVRVIESNK